MATIALSLGTIVALSGLGAGAAGAGIAGAAGAYEDAKGGERKAAHLQEVANAEAESERRRRAAIAAQSTGRKSTLLSGSGGPQPAASRVTLLGGA